MSSPRFRKRLISFVYHAVIFAVTVIGVGTKTNWMITIGVFDLLTFRLFPVSRFIQSILITTAYCSNCQETIELNGQWQCGCGYASSYSRHIFLPCPHCGKTYTFISCSCEMGILI